MVALAWLSRRLLIQFGATVSPIVRNVNAAIRGPLRHIGNRSEKREKSGVARTGRAWPFV
jgi:hypothetical protein